VKTPEPPHPLHLHTISTHPTVVPSARCWHASSRGTDRDGGQSPFRWAPRQANRPGPLWQTPGRGNIFTFSKYRHSMCGCVVAEPWGKFLRRPSTLDSSVPEDDACRKVGPGADLAVGSGNCRGGCLVSLQARAPGAATGGVTGLQGVLPLRTKQKSRLQSSAAAGRLSPLAKLAAGGCRTLQHPPKALAIMFVRGPVSIQCSAISLSHTVILHHAGPLGGHYQRSQLGSPMALAEVRMGPGLRAWMVDSNGGPKVSTAVWCGWKAF
jgi:hypothetical protein